MLSNAVSSAVDRLYASAPRVEDRTPVDRVGAVVRIDRVRAIAPGEAADPPEQRDERADARQRHALARGVLAVFEASVAGESAPVGNGDSPEASGESADRRAKAADPAPDPLLEEAILRFIHSMFRSLAEAQGVESDAVPTRADAAGTAASGRAQLSARIDALARRLADGPGEDGDAGTGFGALAAASGGRTLSDAERSLDQAFAEVLQALSGNLGGSPGSTEAGPETRSNLAQLMQRLALAMHGAPPVDPGLPTRGALLSERA